MAKRSRRLFGLTLVAALGALAALAALWAQAYPDRALDGEGVEVEVTIPPGTPLARTAELLADARVIEHPLVFRLYAMRRADAAHVRAGTYRLRDDMPPREVLDVLVRGAPEPDVAVTIPEGYHILEVFELLDERGIADRAELEELAFDPEFLEARGIDGPSAEGYLFPDTYRFFAGSPAEAVLDRMIEQHRAVLGEILEAHADSVARLRDELGWNERDLITMASIVEKEAVSAEERPRIAQVFINRLTSPRFRPRLLQTDPTIRYGCMVPLDGLPAGCEGWTSSDRLRRRQLDDGDNPYNTYQHEGLPPGPICSPGRAAIEATVAPDGSDYLYFVSRNDGTHVFSRTLAEHNQAVNQYQRRARAR